MAKKWYVWGNAGKSLDAGGNWKPVDDVRYEVYDDGNIVAAIVRDHNDERLFYCVHPARTKYVEVKE